MITWERYTGTAEASDLGLKPGEWPITLNAEGPDGVSRTFVRKSMLLRDGDMIGYAYSQPREDLARLGLCLILTVLND